MWRAAEFLRVHALFVKDSIKLLIPTHEFWGIYVDYEAEWSSSSYFAN